MHKHKNKELLRIKLSITQEDFADYLGITRGLLSMYEKGMRSLPTPALIKLSKLEILYLHMKTAIANNKRETSLPHPQLQECDAKAKNEMKAHAVFCKGKSTFLQYRLEKMIEDHSKAITCLQMLDEMASDLPADNEKARDQLWVKIQRQAALEKAIKYGIAAQAKLQATIHILTATAEINNKLYEEL